MSTTARLVVLGVLAAITAAMWGMAVVSKRFERVASDVVPLEDRHFDSLTLIALGTGGTFENPDRVGPVLAIASGDALVLVDAGRGVAEALRRAEIPVAQPRTVLLTSLQAEDTVGLDDLWLTGALAPREGPLRVVGPPGTRALVEGLERAHAAARDAAAALWGLPPEALAVTAEEVPEAMEFAVGPLAIRGRALPGGAFPALAWRVAANDQAITVSSVGFGGEALDALAQGSSLLVVGALYGASLDAALAADGTERPEVLRAEGAQHLRLEDAGALASRVHARALVLTRLRPPPVFDFQFERVVAPSFPGPVFVAHDGQELTP